MSLIHTFKLAGLAGAALGWATPDAGRAWALALALICIITLVYAFLRYRLRTLGTINRLTALAWNATGIPTFVRSLPKLRMEIASARRYQRPLSLVVLALESPEGKLAPFARDVRAAGSNGNGSHSASCAETIQFLFPLMGSVLQESLRCSDRVTYDAAHDQYIIVFPQTKKPECEQAVYRLRNLLIKRSSMNVKTGVAEFPPDGLILEDLVGAARIACQRQELDEPSMSSAGEKDGVRAALPQMHLRSKPDLRRV